MEQSKKYKLSLVLGRFNYLHNGHVGLFKEAMRDADGIMAIVGSAGRGRSKVNPLLVRERVELTTMSLKGLMKPRTRIGYCTVDTIGDFSSDDTWICAVEMAVYRAQEEMAKQYGVTPQDIEVTLFGYEKDNTSYYLNKFHSWGKSFTGVKADGISATDLKYLHIMGGWRDVEAYVPASTLTFLKRFENTSGYEWLRDLYRRNAAEMKKFEDFPYPGHYHALAADAVVVCDGRVLMGIRTDNGMIALPGGHKADNESFYDCALRELDEETGIALNRRTLDNCFKSQHTFDDPRRSSKPYPVVTKAHYFTVGSNKGKLPTVTGGDDFVEGSARWWTLAELEMQSEQIHDDHLLIIKYFVG